MNILTQKLKKDKSITLQQIIDSWLLYKKYKLKESTYYRYQYIIKKYIISNFGKEKPVFLEHYDFNIFIEKLAENLSPKTTKDIIIVLKSILKYAERKYNFDFKLDLVALPKYEPEEIEILSKEEKNQLEEMCYKNTTLRNIGILICLNTGLRIGEICALTWKDINLEKDTLSIDKTMQRIYKDKNNTIIVIDTPKSKKSIRTIPISKKMHNILCDIKINNKIIGNEFFLTGENDKYIEPRSYQNMFKKCLKECDVKDYNFHALRHTFATNCIEIGMDVKSLSEILGHASVDITLNKYVHSSLKTKKMYLEKL